MIQAHPPLSMAKKSPSVPEGKPDEPVIYRFKDDKLVDPRDNTIVVHGKIADLFLEPLRIHRPDEETK